MSQPVAPSNSTGDDSLGPGGTAAIVICTIIFLGLLCWCKCGSPCGCCSDDDDDNDDNNNIQLPGRRAPAPAPTATRYESEPPPAYTSRENVAAPTLETIPEEPAAEARHQGTDTDPDAIQPAPRRNSISNGPFGTLLALPPDLRASMFEHKRDPPPIRPRLRHSRKRSLTTMLSALMPQVVTKSDRAGGETEDTNSIVFATGLTGHVKED